jgi:hypothetical protein
MVNWRLPVSGFQFPVSGFRKKDVSAGLKGQFLSSFRLTAEGRWLTAQGFRTAF